MDDKKVNRSPLEDLGRKVDEAIPKIEEEVQRVIAYLNDKVVPEVRTQSSQALRAAAEQLAKLAEHMERGNRK